MNTANEAGTLTARYLPIGQRHLGRSERRTFPGLHRPVNIELTALVAAPPR
jgi:hypothetical protein